MRRAALIALCVLAVSPAAAQAAAPRVEAMVVGKGRTLLEPATVPARATTVRVAGRRCAVGAATPLAVLAAAGRAGGPTFSLRDYGSCSRASRDAGGLFVTRVGRDRNRGRDGWTYKVGRRAGTTAAADPSGPFGNGRRIAAGARVVWFWCRLRSGGCQRTLSVRAPRRVAAGASLTVTVTGHDDAGRGRRVRGATVALAGVTAATGADGTATLAAPATAGRHTLTATAPRLVRSFPEEVTVA